MVCVIVTAPASWSSTHGIDMWASRAFKDQPVGFMLDGWTIASLHTTRAEADRAHDEARRQGQASIMLVFDDAPSDEEQAN